MESSRPVHHFEEPEPEVTHEVEAQASETLAAACVVEPVTEPVAEVAPASVEAEALSEPVSSFEYRPPIGSIVAEHPAVTEQAFVEDLPPASAAIYVPAEPETQASVEASRVHEVIGDTLPEAEESHVAEPEPVPASAIPAPEAFSHDTDLHAERGEVAATIDAVSETFVSQAAAATDTHREVIAQAVHRAMERLKPELVDEILRELKPRQ